jgi:crossover junction endodeoxyribonuclease RuvC
VAAVEDVFIARDSRAALKLGQARGAALVPLLRSGLEVHEYAARLVKRNVAGYGGADKEQVRRMVKILLGLGTARLSFDASDALAIAGEDPARARDRQTLLRRVGRSRHRDLSRPYRRVSKDRNVGARLIREIDR